VHQGVNTCTGQLGDGLNIIGIQATGDVGKIVLVFHNQVSFLIMF
jgi:hypothetical protein